MSPCYRLSWEILMTMAARLPANNKYVTEKNKKMVKMGN
jgi:hypothetical protein